MRLFHRLVHDERFCDVPMILETPWVAVGGTDKKAQKLEPFKDKLFTAEVDGKGMVEYAFHREITREDILKTSGNQDAKHP